MSFFANLQRALSNIIFILALLVAAAIILTVENSEYATLGAPKGDGADWTVKLGSVESAEQAQEVCRAVRAADVACVIIPPER